MFSGANIEILGVNGRQKNRKEASFFGSGEEVFQNLPPLRVLFIKQFRVKLHTKNGPFIVLHRLNGTRFIRSCHVKAFGY